MMSIETMKDSGQFQSLVEILHRTVLQSLMDDIVSPNRNELRDFYRAMRDSYNRSYEAISKEERTND